MRVLDGEARLEDRDTIETLEHADGARHPNRRARQIETVAPAAVATPPVHTRGR